MITIKRIYEPYETNDGYRILIDRLWPRGIAKEKAHVDLWLKDIAPSTQLRQWFHHDTTKWPEFIRQYKAELSDKAALIAAIRQAEVEHVTVTLLYGARDTHHNQAVVLRERLGSND